MAVGMHKMRLGRSLASLIGEGEGSEFGEMEGQRLVALDTLKAGRFNPRRNFSEAQIQELAVSIRERGLVQPLVVRPVRGEHELYEIVAGERRWRAAQIAKLHEVPVLERDLADREVLELAIVENVQRNDLSALEEAEGYRRLIDEFGRSQEELAHQVGKSRVHITNTLRLLKLPESVKNLLATGKLSAGHARALLAAGEPEVLAQRVVALGLSVRQTERLAARPRVARRRGGPIVKDADTRALENDTARALGLKIEIEHGNSGGRLIIRYRTLEQLDEVVRRLSRDG
jgi:ParB family transcriptional regulator, chromosome partitioning protein